MIDRSVVETYVVETDTVMLDQILWRRYRRKTPGLFEAALDMNPGLAAIGPNIPRGTVIAIPLDRPDSVTTLPVVRLW
jgi:phage tail protein X